MTPRIVADVSCEIGENQLYHPNEQLVYWCDIPTSDLYACDPNTDTHDHVRSDSDERTGGAMYRLDTDGSFTSIGSSVGLPNGIHVRPLAFRCHVGDRFHRDHDMSG